GWLATLARRQPVAVVLDDLQWADRSSLELLDFLARSLHDAAVLLVGTYRDDELAAESVEILGALTSRAGHIRLTGLTSPDVKELVADVAGPAIAEEWAGSIHQRSGGR